ncbi:nuclear transport factor 2 family protein [Actinomadura sp. LOL_016]|uniref:nuclear transport factor 2 family protein n=1 Tax=unclassified Actinomadura TaxID=2626254 RepID=UPI003A804853
MSLRWMPVRRLAARPVLVQRGEQVVVFMRQGEVEAEHTQHTTTDLLVDVDGDQAAASANSTVYYRDGRAPHFTGGLRQRFTATRTPAGRRLREARITPAWTREN